MATNKHGTQIDGEALINAAMFGYIPKVRRCVENGVDLESRDENGETALMWAAREGRKETVALLLECGADVNAWNKAARSALDLAKSKNHADCIDILESAVERANIAASKR